jgi:NAD+ synthase (glutamine-hydrolysing)
VIGDVFKTMVYKLAEWRNRQQKSPLIPLRIFEKEPSAELRHNHKVPIPSRLMTYLILCWRLYREKKTAGQLVAEGFDPSVVRMIIGMVDRNEYKRRQCPIGVSISDSPSGEGGFFLLRIVTGMDTDGSRCYLLYGVYPGRRGWER